MNRSYWVKQEGRRAFQEGRARAKALRLKEHGFPRAKRCLLCLEGREESVLQNVIVIG